MKILKFRHFLLLIAFSASQLFPSIVAADAFVDSKDEEVECRFHTGILWGFSWPSFGNKYTIPSNSKKETRIELFDEIWVSDYLKKLNTAQDKCEDAYEKTNTDEMLYRFLLASLKEKYTDENFDKLKRLAEKGYIPAQGFLSLVYYVHFEDFNLAHQWAKTGHANNNPAASEILGHLYSESKIEQKDLKKAIDLYEIAVGEASHEAAYKLFLIHSDKSSGYEDIDKSKKYLTQAYYIGSAKAAIQLGIQYTFGINRNVDKYKAKEFFETAIKRGNFSNGYFNLGLLYASLEPYSNYRFVSHNFYQDAKTVFEMAVSHGYPNASNYVLEMDKRAKEYPKTKEFREMLQNNYKRVLAERKIYLQERAERYRPNNGSIGGPEILLGIIGAGILAGSLANNPSSSNSGEDVWEENRRNLNQAITPGAVDLWLN